MTLEWTGERFIPNTGPEIAYEHYSRYLFARQFCKGKSVVDLPCGDGYGAALLADVASSVVGLDIAPEAITHAQQTYRMPNVRFARADMTDFNHALTAPVDVIVCYEGIEHIDQDAQAAACLAMAQALHDDGLLIMSTPNKRIYTDLLQSNNPFHQHELYTPQYVDLLRAQFPFVYLFGQTLADVALINPLFNATTLVERHFIEFEDGQDALHQTIGDADRFTYLVAVASKRELEDAATLGGYFLCDLNRKSLHMHRTLVAAEAKPLTARLEVLSEQHRQLAQENEELAAHAAALEAENATLVSQSTSLSQSYASLAAEVEYLRFHYHRKVGLATRELAKFIGRVPLAKQVATATALPVARAIWYAMKRRRAVATYQEQLGQAQPATPAEAPADPSARERTIHQMLQSFAKKDRATYQERDRWYSADEPEVSVIILNLNKADLTIRCVKELWKYTTGRPYEIIVVDNGSHADDFVKLTRFQGKCRVIRLERNRFFGEGNNIGAETARGKYVCFLNNDAFVTAGWLESFMKPFERDEEVGAVGPMFLYPDGTLQEAGSLVNADGTANMLGRLKDKDDPEFNYEREVDYCSAAGLMVRRELFEQVLGFDLCWEPAYYEDVDLCMKIKQLGYKVLYCPEAKIVHIEHFTALDGSHSINFSNVVDINRHKFVARWRDHLTETGTVFDSLPESSRAQVRG